MLFLHNDNISFPKGQYCQLCRAVIFLFLAVLRLRFLPYIPIGEHVPLRVCLYCDSLCSAFLEKYLSVSHPQCSFEGPAFVLPIDRKHSAETIEACAEDKSCLSQCIDSFLYQVIVAAVDSVLWTGADFKVIHIPCMFILVFMVYLNLCRTARTPIV